MHQIALALLFSSSLLHAAEWKFHFTSSLVQPGFTRVTPETAYDAKTGFGFMPIGTVLDDNKPQLFAVDADEGNYEVSVRLGHATQATSTTIKAESRRLMLEKIETAAGKFETRTFIVNVRRPGISADRKVSLKETEKPVPNWDDRLSFEFNGKQPGVAFMQIKPVDDVVTVFLAGDSTVTDQNREPYAGWGQMLPRFFGPSVAISNHAWSGLALFSFEGGKRLEKILSQMKKGDYLFVQFGHNDQKDKSKDAGPFKRYKTNLKEFIAAARSKGGIPVLVTPMERRRFERDGSQTATLADYAEAVRQAGAEENVPVIDLNAMSLKLYAALGPDESKRAFVHYPANTFPGQSEALADDTHHGSFGGYELARCMVEGIKTNVPELTQHLAADAGTFDPAKPDSPEKFDLPRTPAAGTPEKPDGN
ncbi:MAG: rhamnogalacturonan acetylesterase [Prosthecobacter sp.]